MYAAAGCLCSLAKKKQFDYLLIESTGISEPMPVAETFTFSEEEGGSILDKFARLDTMVRLSQHQEGRNLQ